MKHFRLYFLFAFVAVRIMTATTLAAQGEMKIPALTTESFGMTRYPADTSAVAVCLYSNELTRIGFGDRYSMHKTREIFKRIKILKEEGKSYADYVLYHDVSTDRFESLVEYRVTTHNIRDGHLETVQMSPSFMFRSPMSPDVEKLSFTAEKVEVGSIIDFYFLFTSNAWYDMDDIVLQMDIPVLKAEATIRYPSTTAWHKMSYGYRALTQGQEKESFSDYAGGGLEDHFSYDIISDKYSLDNIAAFRKEAFCWYPQKYHSAIQYDLSEYYSFYNNAAVKVQNSWEEVDNIVREETFFKVIKGKSPFAKELESIKGDASMSEKDKIVAVIGFVRNAIKWNGDVNAALCEVKKAMKEGTGNNVVINSLVASSLNTIGIKCSPVMITLRNMGYLADFHASVNSFNTFVLCAETSDGKSYYFDASLRSAFLNVLPAVQLAEKARKIPVSGKGSWVNLSSISKGTELYDVAMKVDTDGSISGNVKVTMAYCDSYEFRNTYAGIADARKFTDTFFNSPDYSFNLLDLSGINEYSPSLVSSASFSGETASDGEYLYVNPFVKAFHDPTQMPDVPRNCDIEMPYRKNINYRCSLTVPEGYAVKSLPKDNSLSCPFLRSTARIQCTQKDGDIIIDFNYSLGGVTADRAGYAQIRKYWQELGDIYNEVVVFEKK